MTNPETKRTIYYRNRGAAKAYKDKMTKSHPDKVSHLSKALQDKAQELTLELNAAYDLIKKYKKK